MPARDPSFACVKEEKKKTRERAEKKRRKRKHNQSRIQKDCVVVVRCLNWLISLHRGPRADPQRIQRNILEEQVELWWFQDPKRSILCYCASVLLILGCGLGGVGLLSTSSSLSSEWRLGVGMALCLLALAVLLKQLLSSAIQDMNCVRSRQRIEMLRSGGVSDHLVILATGLVLLLCGAVLLILSDSSGLPKPGSVLNEMFISGAVLAAAGAVTVFSLFVYVVVTRLRNPAGGGQRFLNAGLGIFTVSGRMAENARETTSSMANLI